VTDLGYAATQFHPDLGPGLYMYLYVCECTYRYIPYNTYPKTYTFTIVYLYVHTYTHMYNHVNLHVKLCIYTLQSCRSTCKIMYIYTTYTGVTDGNIHYIFKSDRFGIPHEKKRKDGYSCIWQDVYEIVGKKVLLLYIQRRGLSENPVIFWKVTKCIHLFEIVYGSLPAICLQL